MNITLTGNLGSGKTSVCKELEKMGYNIVSTGTIFREIAAEKGISVIELNELAKKDRSIDDLIDNRSIQLGNELDNTVFDSRLAWHFATPSFKVFLLVDTEEAARRVFEGDSRNAEEYNTLEEAAEGLSLRAKIERERFSELYGIDYYDGNNYDLIIESSNATPEQIAKEIVRNFEIYKEHPFPSKVELNLKCLYPTQKVSDFSSEVLDKYYANELDNDTLCSTENTCITIKDGYNYILDEHHHVFAAMAAGKIFTEIRSLFVDDKSLKAVPQNSKSDLYDFEDIGKFKYSVYPQDKPVKHSYSFDFSNIFSQCVEKEMDEFNR